MGQYMKRKKTQKLKTLNIGDKFVVPGVEVVRWGYVLYISPSSVRVQLLEQYPDEEERKIKTYISRNTDVHKVPKM